MIEVEIESAGVKGIFLAEELILVGLWKLNETNSIAQNMVSFDIQFEPGLKKQQIKSDITKRNDFAILTIEFSPKSKTQFLVSKELSVETLDKVKDTVITKDFKKLIKDAFKMTQKSILLGDFFK